jgi:hypothetical protein
VAIKHEATPEPGQDLCNDTLKCCMMRAAAATHHTLTPKMLYFTAVALQAAE